MLSRSGHPTDVLGTSSLHGFEDVLRTSRTHPPCLAFRGDMLNSVSRLTSVNIADVHQASTRLFRPVCLIRDYAILPHLLSTCHELSILFIASQPLHTPALDYKRLPINACILLLTAPIISYSMFKATAASRTAFPVVSCLG